VYRDLMKKQTQVSEYPQGAFLAAALEIVHQLESPLKEETLVRLAVLELASERTEVLRLKAVG
jgi:hypothetical protein